MGSNQTTNLATMRTVNSCGALCRGTAFSADVARAACARPLVWIRVWVHKTSARFEGKHTCSLISRAGWNREEEEDHSQHYDEWTCSVGILFRGKKQQWRTKRPRSLDATRTSARAATCASRNPRTGASSCCARLLSVALPASSTTKVRRNSGASRRCPRRLSTWIRALTSTSGRTPKTSTWSCCTPAERASPWPRTPRSCRTSGIRPCWTCSAEVSEKKNYAPLWSLYQIRHSYAHQLFNAHPCCVCISIMSDSFSHTLVLFWWRS